ncbi:BZ3500_MvSof-1268-A1-R1_Chr4-3g07264 [Microbotryum saponariae]|uniref:BZ3500_MvSof-1268-A1-R1_Chr4-3g07264 protein n=1 Tax=Microbotryum saponariae TaxID=289078 RepID=A0A2X0NMG6_9BASI|nr:BZ3500_MvSof-1268-A1-R1_Chr4-3g07264 [Microbotryum saponariae]SDA06927.1 BZ3501_MvSof-1269-A2-R1_Chr4-2g06973 [Microbotryum saponariae]
MTHSTKRTPCTQVSNHLELVASLSFLLPSPRRRALHFSHHLILPTSPPFSGGYERWPLWCGRVCRSIIPPSHPLYL